ncbi:unnamed protein product [Brassicogethes aeneus]|uniref:Tektin n=1 Tax=Brassicogethes aeneus TaxID=1431903 RepID=A0A9P0FBD1_BRAAE|nr:unnamed protein product [Brassicogethes aeneus]
MDLQEQKDKDCASCHNIAHFQAKNEPPRFEQTSKIDLKAKECCVKHSTKSGNVPGIEKCETECYNYKSLNKRPIDTKCDLDDKNTYVKGILKNSANALRVNDCCCHPAQNYQQPQAEMHATAGRTPPEENKEAPSPYIPEIVGDANPPCYLPQPGDEFPQDAEAPMVPVGPWATGRIDWGPLSGLTGTRPIVDKYSITRFSEAEWRKHNKEILEMAAIEQHRANLIDWNSRQCLEQTQADVDKNQEKTTNRLNQRELEIHRWKCELERAIAAASEEITFMEEQRQRLKQASAVLQLPEAIAGECLERRTGRLDPELVRDEVEVELMKELALTAEIRETFARTLKDVQAQLTEDKTAKARLEYDWSDKIISHGIETLNQALTTKSTVLMFHPGSVICQDDQSTLDYWEHFTREILQEGEATRQRSVTLRGTLDAILINAARDLRSQADRVELALSRRIACTEETSKRLEVDLLKILQRLADVESIVDAIRAAIRRLDFPMKKAQTRLNNRQMRPRVENCRDEAHFGLLEEVKELGENVAALQAQLKQAEDSQTALVKARSDLEREIMVKRKTLEIDRDRTSRIRSHYPSTTALAGYS